MNGNGTYLKKILIRCIMNYETILSYFMDVMKVTLESPDLYAKQTL